MFKFTIREMLWLTVVAAIAVAWWLDRARLVQDLDWWSRAVEVQPGVWTEF